MNTPGDAEEARALLAELPPGKDAALLHLLTCPTCRTWATHRLLEEAGAGERLPDEDALWSRLHERLPWLLEEADRRSAEVEAVFVELVGYTEAEQAKVLEDPRFHSFELLGLLLEASQETQAKEVEHSTALADLGTQLANRLLRQGRDEVTCALYLARAATLQGNARRLMGKLREAEDALGRAASSLAWPFESWDRAAYCRALGLLRWEQGRLDEAAALLWHAAWAFSEQCLPHEEGASLVLLGLLWLEQNRVKKAARLLHTGRAALDPLARPWLTVRAGLSLALAWAELGRLDQATAVLNETFWHYAGVRDEREDVRIYWLEGKISARLGRREEAEQLLSAVRGKLIAEHSLPEAVLCSLDLAGLLVKDGRAAQVPALLDEIEASFAGEEKGLDVTRRVVRVFLDQIAGASEVSRSDLARAASTLRRIFRLRGYRVERLPFA